MMTVEERMKVKVLWLANWSAREIAEFMDTPVEDIEKLLAIYRDSHKKNTL